MIHQIVILNFSLGIVTALFLLTVDWYEYHKKSPSKDHTENIIKIVIWSILMPVLVWLALSILISSSYWTKRKEAKYKFNDQQIDLLTTIIFKIQLPNADTGVLLQRLINAKKEQ